MLTWQSVCIRPRTGASPSHRLRFVLCWICDAGSCNSLAWKNESTVVNTQPAQHSHNPPTAGNILVWFLSVRLCFSRANELEMDVEAAQQETQDAEQALVLDDCIVDAILGGYAIKGFWWYRLRFNFTSKKVIHALVLYCWRAIHSPPRHSLRQVNVQP